MKNPKLAAKLRALTELHDLLTGQMHEPYSEYVSDFDGTDEGKDIKDDEKPAKKPKIPKKP